MTVRASRSPVAGAFVNVRIRWLTCRLVCQIDGPLMAASATPNRECRSPLHPVLPTVMDRPGPFRRGETLLRMPGDSWVFYRFDYHLATPGVAALARREAIYLDQRFSDHAPLTIDYDFEL